VGGWGCGHPHPTVCQLQHVVWAGDKQVGMWNLAGRIQAGEARSELSGHPDGHRLMMETRKVSASQGPSAPCDSCQMLETGTEPSLKKPQDGECAKLTPCTFQVQKGHVRVVIHVGCWGMA
jgi:hypothetical protein